MRAHEIPAAPIPSTSRPATCRAARRPNQLTTRPSRIVGHPPANAKQRKPRSSKKLTNHNHPLAVPDLSEYQPANNFKKLENASDAPSIHPSAAAATWMSGRNPGSTAITISCEASESRLVTVMPQTLRFSQLFIQFSAMTSGESVPTANMPAGHAGWTRDDSRVSSNRAQGW